MTQVTVVHTGRGLRTAALVRDILLVCGILSSMLYVRIAGNLPTPYLGITERVNVYSAMLWVVVLGLVLLRSPITPMESRAT
jgi:hypothetical protein